MDQFSSSRQPGFLISSNICLVVTNSFCGLQSLKSCTVTCNGLCRGIWHVSACQPDMLPACCANCLGLAYKLCTLKLDIPSDQLPKVLLNIVLSGFFLHQEARDEFKSTLKAVNIKTCRTAGAQHVQQAKQMGQQGQSHKHHIQGSQTKVKLCVGTHFTTRNVVFP